MGLHSRCRQHRCTRCNQLFTHSSQLWEHVQLCGIKNIMSECTICHKQFSTSRLERHKMLHATRKKSATGKSQSNAGSPKKALCVEDFECVSPLVLKKEKPVLHLNKSQNILSPDKKVRLEHTGIGLKRNFTETFSDMNCDTKQPKAESEQVGVAGDGTVKHIIQIEPQTADNTRRLKTENCAYDKIFSCSFCDAKFRMISSLHRHVKTHKENRPNMSSMENELSLSMPEIQQMPSVVLANSTQQNAFISNKTNTEPMAEILPKTLVPIGKPDPKESEDKLQNPTRTVFSKNLQEKALALAPKGVLSRDALAKLTRAVKKASLSNPVLFAAMGGKSSVASSNTPNSINATAVPREISACAKFKADTDKKNPDTPTAHIYMENSTISTHEQHVIASPNIGKVMDSGERPKSFEDLLTYLFKDALDKSPQNKPKFTADGPKLTAPLSGTPSNTSSESPNADSVYVTNTEIGLSGRYTCSQCSLKFYTAVELDQHSQTHHVSSILYDQQLARPPNQQTPEQSTPYKCLHCHVAFSSLPDIITHMDEHSNKQTGTEMVDHHQTGTGSMNQALTYIKTEPVDADSDKVELSDVEHILTQIENHPVATTRLGEGHQLYSGEGHHMRSSEGHLMKPAEGHQMGPNFPIESPADYPALEGLGYGADAHPVLEEVTVTDEQYLNMLSGWTMEPDEGKHPVLKQMLQMSNYKDKVEVKGRQQYIDIVNGSLVQDNGVPYCQESTQKATIEGSGGSRSSYPVLRAKLIAGIKAKNSGQQICHLCGKLFNHRGSLQVHLRTHGGIRPYSCQLCPQRFSYNSSLQIHRATNHGGIKPYQCQYCSWRFVTQHGLSDHMVTHTGEMLYRCLYCRRSFSRLSNLNRHVRMCHHQEIQDLVGSVIIHNRRTVHRCVLCGHMFRWRITLLNHVVTKHPEVDIEDVKKHIDTDPVIHIPESKNQDSDFVLQDTSEEVQTELERTNQMFNQRNNQSQRNKYSLTTEAEEEFPCLYCRYSSSRLPNINRHVSMTHRHNMELVRGSVIVYDHHTVYRCILCGHIFRRQNALLNHVKLKHPETDLVDIRRHIDTDPVIHIAGGRQRDEVEHVTMRNDAPQLAVLHNNSHSTQADSLPDAACSTGGRLPKPVLSRDALVKLRCAVEKASITNPVLNAAMGGKSSETSSKTGTDWE